MLRPYSYALPFILNLSKERHMDAPQERVKIAVAESVWLKAYLGSLPSEPWNPPNACDRWAVRDVVAHLAWVAESYLALEPLPIRLTVAGEAQSR